MLKGMLVCSALVNWNTFSFKNRCLLHIDSIGGVLESTRFFMSKTFPCANCIFPLAMVTLLKKPTLLLKWCLYACFILFAALTLIHLTNLPIAWNDETYFMDPAIQFIKTGTYGSRIWPQEGTETFFFAHMPMVPIVHILNLSVFPWEIFYVRLPFVLFFGVGMFFFYKFLREGFGLGEVWSLFFVFLFMYDKATGEALRSVRTESMEIVWMCIVFWRIYTKKHNVWTAFFLSLMVLTHPKLWAMVAILVPYICWADKSTQRRVGIVFVFSLPILAFLAWGHFDFYLIKAQLFTHAEEHNATFKIPGNIFYNHFIERFWPFYVAQPYVYLLYLGSLFVAIKALFKKEQDSLPVMEICFLITNLFWLVKLGPFERYNSVLLFFSYSLVAKHAHPYFRAHILTAKKVVLILCLFPIILFVFMSRHAAAYIQREERDLTQIFKWYDRHFSSKQGKKILFVNESSAHYYSLKHEGIDFSLVYSVKKFDIKDYDEVYGFFWQKIERPGLEFVDEYALPPVLGDASGKRHMTYNYTKLYKITTQEALLFFHEEHLWGHKPCK